MEGFIKLGLGCEWSSATNKDVEFAITPLVGLLRDDQVFEHEDALLLFGVKAILDLRFVQLCAHQFQLQHRLF